MTSPRRKRVEDVIARRRGEAQGGRDPERTEPTDESGMRTVAEVQRQRRAARQAAEERSQAAAEAAQTSPIGRYGW